jgi:hypothetical protein
MKFSEWVELKEGKKNKKPKRDKCYYKVKAKMKVWPSAYGSGLLVQCRDKGADNWGNGGRKKKKKKKNENTEFLTFQQFCENMDLQETKFKLEKDRGLKGWFDRNNGKGWVDCKASKKGHIVPCGRKKAGKGAERKYPACRPTLSMCNKSKHKKKSSKPISWEKD